MNGMFEPAVENRPSAPAFERHYTVNEIGEMWHLAYNTIKAMFKNEPGVFSIGSEETRYGRPRITLLITPFNRLPASSADHSCHANTGPFKPRGIRSQKDELF